jgi:zinc/manganese transport system substrate-binding protein
MFLLIMLPLAQPRAALAVFTCEPEWAALASELGGDKVRARSAITGQQDVHYIQARPSLIAHVRNADLVMCTGADLEIAWLPLLLRQANNPRVQPGQLGFLAASEYVTLLEQPVALDRALGDIHPYGNPHIQTDPRNIGVVAKALAERLEALDPAGSEHYRRRFADFERRWNEALAGWQERGARLAGMRLVVHHDSWVYMNAWLGLEQLGTLEPKPGVPPGAAHLAELLQRIAGADVRAVIRSSYQSPRASEWLARRADIPVLVIPHTVGAVPGADDLFSLYEEMLERLLSVAP